MEEEGSFFLRFYFSRYGIHRLLYDAFHNIPGPVSYTHLDVYKRREYTLIEYAYYLMAKAAGITMNECRIYESEGDHHFMTKRFDRENGKKLHMQTLGALAHISYQEPGACGYELAAMYMKEMGISYKETEEFYRRMVFNCLAVNQDDHVKNIPLSWTEPENGSFHRHTTLLFRIIRQTNGFARIR